ncbi:MAG TPA: class I SAM-dependent methyltransferase, partial [Flexivirga sp.]|nr:class I SAM-dependent methyltransferase [Flexivirga sp.]
MGQNIYDDPEFQAGYRRLARSEEGLAGAPEWPSVRALLPDLTDKQVVDLGCGYGAFARWAAESGAALV